MRLTRRVRRNNHSGLVSRIFVEPYPTSVVKLRVAVPGSSQGTRLRHRSTGVQYNNGDETDGTLGENSHVEDNSANTVEDTSNSSVDVSKTSASATTTSIPKGLYSSTLLPHRTAVPHLAPAQLFSLQRKHPHPGLVLIFVGGALGATLLVLITSLVLRRRRRMQGKRLLDKVLSRRWFKREEEEKSDVVISIRVPPPAVPLKSILVPSATSRLKDEDKLGSDPASLTSTQLSVLINDLPKAHLPDSEHSSVSQVRDEETGVRRVVGPSASDFLANIMGRAGSFASSNWASEASADELRKGANPALPRSFRVSSGPRGHGLVLTGDQHIPASSFAQWRYERSLVRDEASNFATHSPYM